MAAVMLNVGCGHDIREGCINIDLYDDRADVKADVRELPFCDGHADVVIASQILEHFEFKEGERALREWARVLKSGGELVVSVPNMDEVVRMFRDFPEELKAATMYIFYGAQGAVGMAHMSGFTPFSLCKAVRKAGLEVIWMDYNTPRRPTPSVRVVGRKP